VRHGIRLPAVQIVSAKERHPWAGRPWAQTCTSFLGSRRAHSSNVQSLSRYKRARRQDLDANRTLLRQDVVVIGYEWAFRRCGERCEFSIVPIGDHDKSVGIDATGKLALWPEQIRASRPFEARNPAQDCLGLTSGRLVPDQLKMSLPHGRNNVRGCTCGVETRRDETLVSITIPFMTTPCCDQGIARRDGLRQYSGPLFRGRRGGA
jgi:hypothetical protein